MHLLVVFQVVLLTGILVIPNGHEQSLASGPNWTASAGLPLAVRLIADSAA